MSEDRIEMSQIERDVLKVMSVVLNGERTQLEASRLLGKSVRQVRRIQRRLESDGDSGVMHGLRGRASNRKIDESLRREVLKAYETDYPDFGPTLASEKLAVRGLVVSSETLRRWLLAAGLWKRKRRREVHRSRRVRKECFGEMLQADGSIHEWTEGRGEAMVLVAMIDDATSQIEARFYAGETLEGYFDLLGRWLKQHGRPISYYADKNSIFQPQERGKAVSDGKTQFGRALSELGIERIAAHSPQAKGRIERFFETAQDRWVKELRLEDVTTMAQANRLVETRLQPEFNRRFTVKPTSPTDAHRRLGPKHNPAAILSVQTARVVSRDYVVRFRNRFYQLPPPALPGLRGGGVIVEERLDGTLAIRFRDKYLTYDEIDAEGSGFAHSRPLAEPQQNDRAELESTRSSATRPTVGRSGCSPAEPYPPNGKTKHTGQYRPPANHPWRKQFLTPKATSQEPDISIVEN